MSQLRIVINEGFGNALRHRWLVSWKLFCILQLFLKMILSYWCTALKTKQYAINSYITCKIVKFSHEIGFMCPAGGTTTNHFKHSLIRNCVSITDTVNLKRSKSLHHKCKVSSFIKHIKRFIDIITFGSKENNYCDSIAYLFASHAISKVLVTIHPQELCTYACLCL